MHNSFQDLKFGISRIHSELGSLADSSHICFFTSIGVQGEDQNLIIALGRAHPVEILRERSIKGNLPAFEVLAFVLHCVQDSSVIKHGSPYLEPTFLMADLHGGQERLCRRHADLHEAGTFQGRQVHLRRSRHFSGEAGTFQERQALSRRQALFMGCGHFSMRQALCASRFLESAWLFRKCWRIL